MQNVLSLVELVLEDDAERGLLGILSSNCTQTSNVSDHC